MAFGVAAPWRGRSRGAYLDDMRELVAADALDILLTSASNGERLASDGSLDDEITLAVRANDTTDIWNHRGSSYTAAPSRPFRTAELAAVRPFCDLVLYSVTFNNDIDRDLATLEAYRAFRGEAAEVGMRYFLEVFNPNAPVGLVAADVGALRQRRDHPHAGGRHHGAPTAVPEDALQRGRRARRAGGARPVRGGRHPRRFGGHHARHLRAARPGRSGTAPGCRCSAARSSARSRSWTSSG